MRLPCTVFIFTLALTPPLFAGSWDVLNPLYTKHDLISDPPGGVATLSTKDLQKLVLRHANDPNVFSLSEALEFKRKNGGSR